MTGLGLAPAAGITAVTRRTVMSGVLVAGPANGNGNGNGNVNGGNGAPATSPQPAAAAATLLPGQTPLAVQVPPPLRPGPGEALLPRPAVASVPALTSLSRGSNTPATARAVTRLRTNAPAGGIPR